MTSSRPLISILTPSFNQARFLEQAILSVRQQDVQDVEHIVVDGGSEDESVDILRKHEHSYDLRWVSEPDRGQSHAINKGLRLAKGQIVGWLNADDTYVPGAFHSAVNTLNSDKELVWVHGDGFWISSAGVIIGRRSTRPCDLIDLLTDGMIITQPGMFIRREAFDIVGGMDENIQTCMDYDFCLRLSKHFTGRYIPRVLATRRLHEQAKTQTISDQFFADMLYTLDKFFGAEGLLQEIRFVQDMAYSRVYQREGYRAFQIGEFDHARDCLYKSLHLRYPHLLHMDVLRGLVLILESILQVDWIIPGRSKMRIEEEFRAAHGEIVLDFSRNGFPDQLLHLLEGG